MTMTETQMLEHLEWALDAIDNQDEKTAVDHINKIRDHLINKEDEANEATTDAAYAFADARDHHLVSQDFHRALGKDK